MGFVRGQVCGKCGLQFLKRNKNTVILMKDFRVKVEAVKSKLRYLSVSVRKGSFSML